MNKEKFLAALRRRLRVLPADEEERILAYYREMIEDKVESGWAEEDAVREYGSVSALARKILAENPNRRPRNVGKIVAIVLASVCAVALCVTIGLAEVFKTTTWNRSTTDFSNHGDTGNYTYKTYDAPNGDADLIRISAEKKAVVFQPWEKSAIEVRYPTNSYQQYDFGSSGGTLSVVNRDSSDKNLKWVWDDSDAPVITVMLPRDYSGSIEVDTTNSFIKASDFSKVKAMNCTTSNSAISVDDFTAQSFSFQTQNAAIHLKNVSAQEKMEAHTQNAQIDLEKIIAPDITLETENALITGTILGREDEYTISAQTTNAISNLKNRGGGSKRLSVETTNAIISVRFEN